MVVRVVAEEFGRPDLPIVIEPRLRPHRPAVGAAARRPRRGRRSTPTRSGSWSRRSHDDDAAPARFTPARQCAQNLARGEAAGARGGQARASRAPRGSPGCRRRGGSGDRRGRRGASGRACARAPGRRRSASPPRRGPATVAGRAPRISASQARRSPSIGSGTSVRQRSSGGAAPGAARAAPAGRDPGSDRRPDRSVSPGRGPTTAHHAPSSSTRPGRLATLEPRQLAAATRRCRRRSPAGSGRRRLARCRCSSPSATHRCAQRALASIVPVARVLPSLRASTTRRFTRQLPARPGPPRRSQRANGTAPRTRSDRSVRRGVTPRRDDWRIGAGPTRSLVGPPADR